jgi:uncharacterized protein (DUF885 family)
MLEASALTEPMSKAEVTRYCAEPTQASSYLTESLEIACTRELFFARRGSSDTDALRNFHDAITPAAGCRLPSPSARWWAPRHATRTGR